MERKVSKFMLSFNSLERKKIKLVALHEGITMQELIKNLMYNKVSLDEKCEIYNIKA